MMWFDRECAAAVYGDRRHETVIVADRSHGRVDGIRVVRVAPDLLFDFRALPFRDGSFDLVLFDPPHLVRAGPRSWMAAKYGKLGDDWRSDLRAGFAEGFRVLRSGGTLIFKWSESQVLVREVIPLAGHSPLFGNTAGRKGGAMWAVFFKA